MNGRTVTLLRSATDRTRLTGPLAIVSHEGTKKKIKARRGHWNASWLPSPSCLRVIQKVFNAGCRWLVRLDGEAEEIGRLGIPALAVLWRQGSSCRAAAPVRSRRLQRNRRPARAQGAAQQGPLVFLRSARRRVQQELEL